MPHGCFEAELLSYGKSLRDLDVEDVWPAFDLDVWAATLMQTEAWPVLSGHRPDEIVVYVADAC
jgi:hypothetical protein